MNGSIILLYQFYYSNLALRFKNKSMINGSNQSLHNHSHVVIRNFCVHGLKKKTTEATLTFIKKNINGTLNVSKVYIAHVSKTHGLSMVYDLVNTQLIDAIILYQYL